MLNELSAPEIEQPQRQESIPVNKLVWRSAFSSALVAGLLAWISFFVPIIPLKLLCIFASGGLAVTLYRRWSGYRPVTPVMGAKLGLLAGGWVVGIFGVLFSLGLFAANARAELRTVLREKLTEATASAVDPEVRQSMDQLQAYIATDHGLIIMMLLSIALLALLFLIFSALGGALGATIFGRDSSRKE